MSDRIRRLLNSEKSKLSESTPTNIGIELKGNMKPFNDPNIIDIVSQEDVFNKEREDSKKYRIYGNTKLITTNELSDANIFDWDFLFDGNPAVTPNNWLIQVLTPTKSDSNVLIHPRLDPSNPTPFNSLPASYGIPLLSEAQTTTDIRAKLGLNFYMKHNLEVDDYVFVNGGRGFLQVESLGDKDGENLNKSVITTTKLDLNSPLKIAGTAKKVIGVSEADLEYIDPLTATNTLSVTTGGTTYSVITSVGHGLNTDDFIEMRSEVNSFNGLFKVIVVNGNRFAFESNEPNGTLNNTTFRRLDGTPCEYYVRKFEVISTNDYESFETAFSNTIYPKTITNNLGVANKVYSFQFNKDININNVVSNRGGKPTQLYLGFIKRAGQNTHDWSNVTSDWSENFANTQDDAYTLETVSYRVPNGVGTIERADYGDEYYGDFTEFNRLTLIETTISEPIHRFNPTSDGSNGYYFKPFKKLQIRVYSDNVEEAASQDNIINLPPDTITYPDGTRVWRDLLSIGFYEGSNGVNYPFLNNSHYFYSDNTIYLRVQKPNRPLIEQEQFKVGDVQC
jgi:hypothetical protein